MNCCNRRLLLPLEDDGFTGDDIILPRMFRHPSNEISISNAIGISMTTYQVSVDVCLKND